MTYKLYFGDNGTVLQSADGNVSYGYTRKAPQHWLLSLFTTDERIAELNDGQIFEMSSVYPRYRRRRIDVTSAGIDVCFINTHWYGRFRSSKYLTITFHDGRIYVFYSSDKGNELPKHYILLNNKEEEVMVLKVSGYQETRYVITANDSHPEAQDYLLILLMKKCMEELEYDR